MLLLHVPLCLGKLSPGQESYERDAAEVWNPARLPGYVFIHQDVQEDNQVIEDNHSDHVSEYVWKEDKQNTDATEDFDENLALENILLSHSFER